MVARLKLISNPIPWSLVIKTVVLGGIWYFLPFPIFLVLALYFYLVPMFKPSELAAPYFVTLILAFFLQTSFWAAVFVAVSMYLILGTKDLIFINRKAIYETIVFILIFVMFLYFFLGLGSWFGISSILWSVMLALFIYILFKGFLGYEGVLSEELTVEAKGHKFLVLGLSSFLVWQLTWVLVFLPIGSIYQTAVAFLVSVILLELVLVYFSRSLTARKILMNFTLFFILLVLILTSTRWEL